jgi:hypothetical protein
VPYPGRRRVSSRLRASLAPRPASPQPQPRLSPSLARLSPRPRAFGLEQDITRPACLWAREGVWATRITSAKPAAAPHPAPPPRLILTDLTRLLASFRPATAPHCHPCPTPRLIRPRLSAISRPPPRLVPTPRFTGTQARLASAPASPQPQPRPPVAQTQSLWA